jgi:hypothetical protein
MMDDLWKLQLGTGILKPAIALFQQALCQLYMEALEQWVQTLCILIFNSCGTIVSVFEVVIVFCYL